MLDQGLFGLTSFALSVGVANRASAEEFGIFGIAYVVYTVVLGAVEAFTAEVLVVRGAHLPTAERTNMLSAASGTALMFGVLFSIVGFAFLFLASGAAQRVVPPLLVLAPFLFVQDVWRFGFFAAGRARSAALNDLLWAGLLGAGFVVFLTLDGAGHNWITLEWCWSGAGAICGIVGAFQSRCVPRPQKLPGWFRSELRSGGRFASEYLALYGAGQSVLIWVGLFAGLAQSAGYRGATLLFGPIQITLNAVRLAVTPIVVRAYQRGRPNAAWQGGATVGVCAALIAITWGVILLMLPDSVGHHILGNSWNQSRRVLPVILWLTAVQSFGLGAIVLLRVVGAYRQSFRIRLFGALVLLVLSAAAATQGSVAAGGAAALAASMTVAMLWNRGARLRHMTAPKAEAT